VLGAGGQVAVRVGGGEEVVAVFEFVDHELDDVGAADGVADGDRRRA
jgi:hypothetical protein